MLPALYPLVAVAGAGARRLLDRQAAAEAALADQERTLAAQAERERLARDMHDSLAKTVHGIGFAALALSRRIRVDPAGAEEDARKLAEDARTAAQEARELLSGLRGRDDAELPLPTAIRSEAARWGERTGTLRRRLARRRRAAAVAGAARAALDPEGGAGQRRALRPRDARRTSTCAGSATASMLTIADDGDGFEAPERPRRADRRRLASAWPGCASARGWRAAT